MEYASMYIKIRKQKTFKENYFTHIIYWPLSLDKNDNLNFCKVLCMYLCFEKHRLPSYYSVF